MDHLKSHTPTRFSCACRDSANGDPGDPSELVFDIGIVGQPPTKYTLSSGAVKRDDLGQYSIGMTLKAPGQWFYRWRAYGATVTTSQEVRFILDRTNFL